MNWGIERFLYESSLFRFVNCDAMKIYVERERREREVFVLCLLKDLEVIRWERLDSGAIYIGVWIGSGLCVFFFLGFLSGDKFVILIYLFWKKFVILILASTLLCPSVRFFYCVNACNSQTIYFSTLMLVFLDKNNKMIHTCSLSICYSNSLLYLINQH